MSYAVCIVHHGDAAVTRRCIDSVAAADPAPVACVVVWNDSGAPDICSGWEYVVPGENLGYAAGANAGARAAFANKDVEALLLLNNDVEIEPAAPRHLLEALARDKRIAICGPRILESDGESIWHDGGSFEWPSGKHRMGEVIEFVSGCAPLIRRAAFEEAGGFDERYFLTYEDADLCARLRARGWQVAQVSAARVRHIGSASLERDHALARYYRLRNRLLFARQHALDRPATDREIRRLRRRARWDALRWYLSGRAGEARATLAALRDAEDARFGRWAEHR